MMTLETIYALMVEHHSQTCERLEALTVQAKETNGRLRMAEAKVAVLMSALGLIGSGGAVYLGVWLTKVL